MTNMHMKVSDSLPTTGNVRQSLERLPRWSQHLVTWVTGKALPDQKPLFQMPGWVYFVAVLTAFFASIAGSALLLRSGSPVWWLMLPVCWVVTAGMSRVIQFVLCHQAVHKQCSGNARIDQAILQILSTMVWIQNADDYRRDHFHLHHSRGTFGTLQDQDVALILATGFRPGMRKDVLWRRFLFTLISPRYHWMFLKARFLSNFVICPRYRAVMGAAYTAAVLALTVLFGAWDILIFAVLVPLFPLYHISTLCQVLTEHSWFEPHPAQMQPNHYYIHKSWGRFCADPLPRPGLPFWTAAEAWARWVFRLLFYHLVVRIGVIPGDMPQHDYHHRYPRCPDWMIPAYTRQRDINNGHPGYPPYNDVWGFANCLDRVFETLSELPADVDMAGHLNLPPRKAALRTA